jgi:hypothetical protein
MKNYTTVLNDLLSPLSRSEFENEVREYRGDYRCRNFQTWDLLKLCLYGQATATNSSRDLESFLKANQSRLYHWGLKNVSRSNFCHALEKRDHRIFEQGFETLVEKAKWIAGSKGCRFKNPLKIIDGTTIDISLKRFGWAHFRKAKGAVKLHTRINGDAFFPEKMILTDGTVHEVKKMGNLCNEPGVIYTMDRGYDDYKSLYDIELYDSSFVTRMKSNCRYETLCVFSESSTAPVRLDADILFTGSKAQRHYPRVLRKVDYHDAENDRGYTFLTNNFNLSAADIADIYKTRWQIELFFKWIKQNLKIKTFWGTSENAVRIQIWVALILALLVWIHKSLNTVKCSTHNIMQLLRTAVLTRNSILNLCLCLHAPPVIPDKQLFLEGFLC